ncbi:MAG: GNAT family protein [Thermoplasmata archaeon]
MIETNRLVLRPVEMEDAEFLADLINDPKVRDMLGAYSLVAPISVDAERNWIAQANAKDKEAHAIIEVKKEKRPIGILSVKDIDGRNSSAHLSIILERKSWGRGYGSEAIKAAVSFLVERMNVHRIWLRVDEENARAIRCYEKCGFRFDGVVREDHFRNGSWKNSLLMSLLSTEYWRMMR